MHASRLSRMNRWIAIWPIFVAEYFQDLPPPTIFGELWETSCAKSEGPLTRPEKCVEFQLF